MSSRPPRKDRKSADFLTNDILIWVAVAVLFYSLVVLLLAFDSLAFAEFALQFRVLNQVAIIGLVLLGTLGLFFKTVLSGWKLSHVVPLVALVFLLPGVQPAEGCCDNLVAFIAGHSSAVAPVLSEVVLHVLPMIGCGLLVISDLCSRRQSLKLGKRH